MDLFGIDLIVLVTFGGAVNWTVGFLTTVAIFGIVALGLNLQWGYTGVFNFASWRSSWWAPTPAPC